LRTDHCDLIVNLHRHLSLTIALLRKMNYSRIFLRNWLGNIVYAALFVLAAMNTISIFLCCLQLGQKLLLEDQLIEQSVRNNSLITAALVPLAATNPTQFVKNTFKSKLNYLITCYANIQLALDQMQYSSFYKDHNMLPTNSNGMLITPHLPQFLGLGYELAYCTY
jgi:hypothetical protein